MNEEQDDYHTQDSAISGLSLLENETDEFYLKSLEHIQRDKKRMQDAVAGGAQAFRRAHPDYRVALTMENLERRNEHENAPASPQAQRKLHRRTASASDSTSSPNIPPQWGRKGKLQKNKFLGRINSIGSIHAEKKEPNEDPDAIYPHRTLYTGDSPDQDFDTADIALPSVEKGSPHRSRTSRRAFHRSRTDNDPLRQVMELEKEQNPDDSPTSLRSQRRRVSEAVRFRETEEIVTARERLEADQRVFRRPKSSGHISPASQSALSRPEGALLERPWPLHPDTGYLESASGADPSSNGAGGGRSLNQAVRPGARRLSSRDLLRQLARASSSRSASPRDPNHVAKDSKTDKVSRSSSVRSGNQDAGVKLYQKDGVMRAHKSSDGGEGRRTRKEEAASDAQKINTIPTPPPEVERPSPEKARSLRQTPHVTGAWIDTPTAKSPRLRSSKSDDHLTRKASAEGTRTSSTKVIKQPPHPGSALESLIQKGLVSGVEFRALGDHDQNGGATIASLQDLANGNPDQAQSLLALDDDTLELVANVTTPIQFSSKERREEQLALQRMAQSLKTVRRSVRDATRGITRVEQEVETAEASKEKRTCTHCEHCKSYSTAPTLWTVLVATWDAFLRKCYSYNPKNGRLRFTWLGIFLIALTAWLVSEYSLCKVYCQKTHAAYMIGTGVNIYAPAQPFVTFTILIKRPLRFLWEPALHALSLLYGVLWRMSGGPEREARKPDFFFVNISDQPPYRMFRVDKDAEGKLTFWYNFFDWPVPEGEGTIESRIAGMVVSGMATPVRPKRTESEWLSSRAAGLDTRVRPTGAAGFPPEKANTPVVGQLRRQKLSVDDNA